MDKERSLVIGPRDRRECSSPPSFSLKLDGNIRF